MSNQPLPKSNTKAAIDKMKESKELSDDEKRKVIQMANAKLQGK